MRLLTIDACVAWLAAAATAGLQVAPGPDTWPLIAALTLAAGWTGARILSAWQHRQANKQAAMAAGGAQ